MWNFNANLKNINDFLMEDVEGNITGLNEINLMISGKIVNLKHQSNDFRIPSRKRY